MNAQTALELAYNQINNDQKFTFGLQYYGSNLGYLVFMINETYDSFISSAAPFYYWEFLLNGNPALQGIDSTILNDSDTIAFTFTSYAPGPVARAQLDAKHAQRTIP
jgi:hypothetical protein